MFTRSHTLRDTLDIRRVRSKYPEIRRCSLLYADANLFLDMFEIVQRKRVYNIYVTHGQTIRMAYAGYARLRLIR